MISSKMIRAARQIPERAVTNDDLAKIVDTSDEWIYPRTGIKRRYVSTGERTSDLAAGVFQKLLDGSGYTASDVDLIIVTTVTPDYLTPHVACQVQSAAGAINAFAFDINAACTGFVYGYTTADKFIRSGMCKLAAVISADTLSKIVDWTDRTTCVIFGDGAGGVLLGASETGGVLAEDMHSDGTKAMSLTGCYLPQGNAWHVCDDAPQPYVVMSGHGIFDFSVTEVPKSINRTLEKAGLTLDDISIIVPHQANVRIIQGIAKKLGADMSKFYVNINEYGNTSSSSIPIALSEMVEKRIITPGSGERIMLAGYGGGVTWGTMIIQI